MYQHLVGTTLRLSKFKLVFAFLGVLCLLTRTENLHSMTCVNSTSTSHAGLVRNFSDTAQQSNAVVVDRGSGARWATVVDCKHPEWPAHMVLLPANVSPYAETSRDAGVVTRQHLFVWAGEKIKLWSSDNLIRIEIDGIAEETKEEGQRIRVRLLQHVGSYGQSPERQLMGVVRSSGDVELVR